MKILNYIILIIGIILYSILYVIATYSYKYYEKKNKSFIFIFTICLSLAILSYIIKIPLFYYYAKKNTLMTHILQTVIISFVLVIYSKYILDEKIYIHTYIILFLILFLVILNEYLSK